MLNATGGCLTAEVKHPTKSHSERSEESGRRIKLDAYDPDVSLSAQSKGLCEK
jgi:hypothetical protein